MATTLILVVDDEKNIRLTISQSLKSLDVAVQTAVNGEEALEKLNESKVDLMLLDLKMPGMDGMAVLRAAKGVSPRLNVIIITAHGTVDSAVEAMKLGAVDFIQKPFTPNEIRELVTRVIDREEMVAEKAVDYSSLLELTKRYINTLDFVAAIDTARKAIAERPDGADAHNLLGALIEIGGDWRHAQKFYRAALDFDPGHQAAKANLRRTTSWSQEGDIDFGMDDRAGAKK